MIGKATQKLVTVVCAVIVKDNKVLLTQRNDSENPNAHLKWEFPGGKMEFGETPEKAIEREVLEETGVKVEVVELLPFTQTSFWDYS